MASSHGIPRVGGARDAEKERKNIEEYRSLLDAVTVKIRAEEYTDDVLALVSKLLKKNPEYYTIWNHRRRILRHRFDASSTPDHASEVRDLITSELTFIVPLLIQFPKCYWIWNYRRWLLEESEKQLDTFATLRFWEEELGLVGTMLTRDERNFHGWSYRRYVVAQIERLRSEGADPAGATLTESEFAYTDKMIRAKLQNFSALHYRSKLLPRLLQERRADGAARREILHSELNRMQDALIDPFNQSAWFYHQYLMASIGSGFPKTQAIVTDMSVDEQIQIYDQEFGRIREILEDDDDCKWVYEALIMYTFDYARLAGAKSVDREALQDWLDNLRRLDPMRSGRWKELTQEFDVIQHAT